VLRAPGVQVAIGSTEPRLERRVCARKRNIIATKPVGPNVGPLANMEVRELRLTKGRRMRGVISLVALPLVAALVVAAPAQAGGPPTECNGAIIAGSVPGNLVVPSGDFCLIQNTTVGGNVLVTQGAIGFSALGGNTIKGSVLSPGPIVFDIRVLASTVGHDILVAQMQPGSAGGICRSTIGGNVILQNNGGFMNVGSGFPFDVCPSPTSGNHIGGNLIVDSNSGGNTITNNTVDQGVHVNNNTSFEDILENTIAHTLECNNNTPPPFSAGNTADNFVGQCTG
jgi:hypothetical protein